MALIRKTKLIAALLATLVGVPALAAPLATPARSAPLPPSLVQLAVLPQAVRLPKLRRRAAGRMIRLRRLAGLRTAQVWGKASVAKPRPRLPMRIAYARGPPLPRA
jgi:hypothetical protein